MSETPAPDDTATNSNPPLPEGLVAVVKRNCPTCELVAPVLDDLHRRADLTVITQDDPAFPADADWVIHDTDLALSWHHDIETVPTLLQAVDGAGVERTEGWSRANWERLSGVAGLGEALPDWRPGCGSLSVDPSLAGKLAARFSGSGLHSRRVELAALEDEWEAMWDRGWSDGLPVVPPTSERALRMLGARPAKPATSSRRCRRTWRTAPSRRSGAAPGSTLTRPRGTPARDDRRQGVR